jgi:hypothetical protein
MSNAEVVEMKDGRQVEFVGKKRMLKEVIFNGGALIVRCDFRNGESIEFTLSEALRDRAAIHGVEQKVGDEIAGLADVEDAVLAIESLAGRLAAGEWNQNRERGGMAGTSMLAQALVIHTGKDIATIKEFLVKKSQSEKIALRNNPKIQPIIAKIEGEKHAAKGLNTDSMLDELAD